MGWSEHMDLYFYLKKKVQFGRVLRRIGSSCLVDVLSMINSQ